MSNARPAELSGTKFSELNLMYTNDQSLSSEREDLRIQATDKSPDAMAITETRPSQRVSDYKQQVVDTSDHRNRYGFYYSAFTLAFRGLLAVSIGTRSPKLN
ncbi:hypothetical protein SprV_0301136500 [Sparganum proliferum]